jgi:hypothetical protein
MRIKFLIYSFFILIISSVVSCKKSDTNYNSPANDIEKFFSNNGVPLQKFSFAVSSNITQSTAANNSFMIAANSFTKSNGAAVTGNIEIRVKECGSKKDLILSNFNTLSGGIFLSTAGIFYIAAYQNDEVLKLAQGKSINFFINSDFGNGQMMHRYYNGSLPLENYDTDVSWVPYSDTAMISLVPHNNATYYLFSLTTTGWHNAATPVFTNYTKRKITIDTGTDYEASNTALYVSLNGYNVVCKATSVAQGIWEVNNLPDNMPITVVAISKKNNDYYFAKQTATVSDSLVVPLYLNAVTIDDLKSGLENLP